MSAWFAIFTANQDNNPNTINEWNVDSLLDVDLLDSLSQIMKKDGTVEGSIAHTLNRDIKKQDVYLSLREEVIDGVFNKICLQYTNEHILL